MTYEEALVAYAAARNELAQWGDGYGPAAEVTNAEDRLVAAAVVIAEAVAERENI